MSNPIEELLKRVINDPSLLKQIEKMGRESVKATLKERAHKREMDRFGSLDYVNCVKNTCKICGSIQTVYVPMIFDKIDKLHRASALSGILYEEWASLPLKTLQKAVPTCTCCETYLLSLDKRELVHKVISYAARLM